tara:strand:+ start:146 stop:544 length:399 start_codon:yes stop_codon:yes gene_type:complete
MIQRIQTLYLTISTLVCLFSFYLFPLELRNENMFGIDYRFIFQKYSFVLISLLNLICIMLYKKRSIQLYLNRFSILLISLLIISFFVFNIDSLDINNYLILLSAIFNIILIIFANKSILKDKKLIDSINRLR